MTQSQLLELAKQGDPQAIATLMNQTLQPRGITATTDLHDQRLEVILESAQVPNRQVLATFVQKGLATLGIQTIQSVKILGKQTGDSVPVWEQELDLATPSISIPNEYAINGAQKDLRVVPGVPVVPYYAEPSSDNGSTSAIAKSSLIDEADDFDESDPILGGTHGLTYPDYPLGEEADADSETVNELEYDDDDDFDERHLIGTYALDNPDAPLDDELDDDFAVDADYILSAPPETPDAPLFAEQPPLETHEEDFRLSEIPTPPANSGLFDEPDAVVTTTPLYGDDYTTDLDDDLFSSAEPDDLSVNSPSGVLVTEPTRTLKPDSDLEPDSAFVSLDPTLNAPLDEEDFQQTGQADDDHGDDGRDDDEEVTEPKLPWMALVLGLVIAWVLGLIGITLWSGLMRPSPQPAPLPGSPSAAPPASPQAGGAPVPAPVSPVPASPAPTASPLSQGSPDPQAAPILRSSASPQPETTSQAAASDRPTPPAITCTPAPAGASPVILSTLRLESRPATDGDYVVGCITNRSNQAIASVTFSFLGRSTEDANVIQSGSSEVVFSNLQPGQAVPFISAFTINPAVNTVRIQSLSWVPTGANQAQQAQPNLTLTR